MLSLAIKPIYIKGISVGNVEYCIFQYAEDRSFTLESTESSLVELINVLNNFAICSGLKINLEKYNAVWTGLKTGSSEKVCLHIPLPLSK